MSLHPPYGAIWVELSQGRVVPFLGAGASRGDDDAPPTGAGLGKMLADLGNFPSTDDRDRSELAKVASYYEDSDGRASLLGVLTAAFARNFKPRRIHRFLARLEPALLIVTTNYDDLIEQAFEDAGRLYHKVVHVADSTETKGTVLWWKPGENTPEDHLPGRLKLKVNDTPVIYKIHGSIDRHTSRNTFVITEEDYVNFLAGMTKDVAIPAMLAQHLQRCHFLFVGYGLADWNLRLLLRTVQNQKWRSGASAGQEPGRRSWAMQHEPAPLEQQLWKTRSVNIYNQTADDFVAQMEDWKANPDNQATLTLFRGRHGHSC
jgi:NAD-dependent SIR2 family protein deacetylase